MRYRRQRPDLILPLLAMAGTAALVFSVLLAKRPVRVQKLIRDQRPDAVSDAGVQGESRPVERHSKKRAALSPKVADDAGDMDCDGFVRPAGADAMRDPPRRWDRVDEQNDESFPASDPPGNY